MTEKLALQEARRIGRAVGYHEGSAAAIVLLVDRLGHQLLAGAVFPRDEDGGIGGGDEVDQVVYFPNLFALADDFSTGDGFLGFLSEPRDLRLVKDQAPNVSGVLGEQGLEEAQILPGVARFRFRPEEEVSDTIQTDENGKAEPARIGLRDPVEKGGQFLAVRGGGHPGGFHTPERAGQFRNDRVPFRIQLHPLQGVDRLGAAFLEGQEPFTARIEEQKHRIGIGEDPFREVLEEMDESVQGAFGAYAPGYLEERLQLMLGPFQFLGAEGKGLLDLPLFGDVVLHPDDQLHLPRVADEGIRMDFQHSFLSLCIVVHLVALGGTLACRRVSDGATDPVLPARGLPAQHDLVARLADHILQAVPCPVEECRVGLHDMVCLGVDDDEIVGDVVDDLVAEFLC